MVSDYFKAKHNNGQGFDNGIDLTLVDGRTVDVKTTKYYTGNLLEFPNEVKKKTNDLYVFCLQTEKKLFIRGWVSRENFVAQANFKNFGFGMRMFMPVWKLNQDFKGLKP